MRTSRNAQRNLWDEFMRAGNKTVLSNANFRKILILDFQTAERDEQVSRRNQRLANLIYKMF